MIMGFDLGHSSDSIQSSKLLATCLIGGVVLGVSVLGFYLAFPPPRQLSWRRKKKPIRVYMDGCFDMMHYGHCNALRQARALGDQLVVGVVSDAEITANKGPPVTPLNERFVSGSLVPIVLAFFFFDFVGFYCERFVQLLRADLILTCRFFHYFMCYCSIISLLLKIAVRLFTYFFVDAS